VGSDWQESIKDHTAMTASGNEWWERAVDDEGSNKMGKGDKAMAMTTAIMMVGDKEGKGNKEGDSISNEGGMLWRGQLQLWKEWWQQGWRMSDGDESNGNGDGDNVGNGNGNEGGG
jgi:hypothetical protein